MLSANRCLQWSASLPHFVEPASVSACVCVRVSEGPGANMPGRCWRRRHAFPRATVAAAAVLHSPLSLSASHAFCIHRPLAHTHAG